MDNDQLKLIVPMRFAGIETLVEVVPATVVGSQPTAASDRLADAYERAEATIVSVASSVADTFGSLVAAGKKPSQLEVEFSLGVSAEGDIWVARGKAEATLAIRLSYDVVR